MKKSLFTEEQIVFALKQAELGTYVPDTCRKLGISNATFYTWRKKYGGIQILQTAANIAKLGLRHHDIFYTLFPNRRGMVHFCLLALEIW